MDKIQEKYGMTYPSENPRRDLKWLEEERQYKGTIEEKSLSEQLIRKLIKERTPPGIKKIRLAYGTVEEVRGHVRLVITYIFASRLLKRGEGFEETLPELAPRLPLLVMYELYTSGLKEDESMIRKIAYQGDKYLKCLLPDAIKKIEPGRTTLEPHHIREASRELLREKLWPEIVYKSVGKKYARERAARTIQRWFKEKLYDPDFFLKTQMAKRRKERLETSPQELLRLKRSLFSGQRNL